MMMNHIYLSPVGISIPPALIPRASLSEENVDETSSETLSPIETIIPPMLIPGVSLNERCIEELTSETASVEIEEPASVEIEEQASMKVEEPASMEVEEPASLNQLKMNKEEPESEQTTTVNHGNPNIVKDEGYYAKDAKLPPHPYALPKNPQEKKGVNVVPISRLEDSKLVDLLKPLTEMQESQKYNMKPFTRLWLSAAAKFLSFKSKKTLVPIVMQSPTTMNNWSYGLKMSRQITKLHGAQTLKVIGSAVMLSTVLGSTQKISADLSRNKDFNKYNTNVNIFEDMIGSRFPTALKRGFLTSYLY